MNVVPDLMLEEAIAQVPFFDDAAADRKPVLDSDVDGHVQADFGHQADKPSLPSYFSDKSAHSNESTPMSMSASSTPASRKRAFAETDDEDMIVPSWDSPAEEAVRPAKRAFITADAAEPFPKSELVDNMDLLTVAAQSAARHILAKVDRTIVLDVDHPSFADFRNEPVKVPLDIYITRLVKLFKSDATIIAAAVVYMDRLLAKNDRLKLTEVNTHRLTFLCLMAASKVMTDIPYNNKYMARVSGSWSLARVNKMEHEFLRLIDFQLYVSREESDRTIRRLVADF